MIVFLCLVLQFGLSLKLFFKFSLRSQMKEGNHSDSNGNGSPPIELLICPKLCCNCFILMNSFINEKRKKRCMYIIASLLPLHFFLNLGLT